MTSLSLARLQADIDDWLTWHHGMDDFTPPDDLDEDDLDADAYHYFPGDENDDEDPEPELGFGWGVMWDYASRDAAALCPVITRATPGRHSWHRFGAPCPALPSLSSTWPTNRQGKSKR